jgi:translation initiation factor IF-2
MDRVKIQEIASEAGASNAVLIEKAKELGYDVKAGNSTLTIEEADILVNYAINGVKPKKEEKPKPKKRIIVKKRHAGIVSTPKKAKGVSAIKEVKREDTPKPKKGIEIKSRATQQGKSPKVGTTPKKEQSIENEKVKEKRVIAQKKISQSVIEKSIEKKEPKGAKKTKGKKKRVGITVIKKADREKPKIRIVDERKPDSEISVVKKSKSKPKGRSTPPSKKRPKKMALPKDSGEKLDFMTHANFGTGRTAITEVEEEPEVMMLDFSDKNIYEDMMRQEQKRKEEAKKRAILGITQQQNRVVSEQHKKRSLSGLRRGGKRKKYIKEENKEQIKSVQIPEDVRVYEFAEKIGRSTGEVIRVLFNLGTMFTQNDFLDKDSIEILADEFDVEVTTINPLDALDYVKAYDAIEDKNPIERPPVITIMGHVDHGKTSLLDRIRKTKVATKEAGGITQHVGAYQIEKSGKKISFIDTPGHSAFTEMRSRGAQATDIVIIVVAADDGVKKQTKEAISHARAANVPIVVAINKMDKQGANPELIRSQLAELGITPVEWGGEHEFIEVSAHTGQGIDDLLETLLLTAEVMELKADANRNAKAIVVESSVEKGFGSVADVIVQNGTLKIGDSFVVGTTYGKVKTMILDDGTRAKAIGPSTPAAIVGLSKVPTAGDILIVMDNEKEAKEIADKRAEYERAKELSKSQKVTLEDLSAVIAEGNLKTLPVIIKTDVQGSLEAIKSSLAKLKNEEVKVDIIHEGVGGVSESDVQLANASEHSIILGFNVRPTGSVKRKAKELGVEIKTYSVIFELIDDIKALLGGMMSPVISEEITGQAEVRETFIVAKVGTIAGCKVSDGLIMRNAGARLIRNGVVIYTTKVKSLKRFNDDVKEVKSGFECGIMLDSFNDIKEGDVIETFKVIEEQVTL